MKTLILTRHAKSSWETDTQSDFDRPLNARGVRDTPVMARRLLTQGPLPQFIITSTAVRTMQTARLLMQELNLTNPQLSSTEAIYEAPMQALLDCVVALSDDHEVAMLVGHNPGTSSLCNYLCEEGRVAMPTCAMACLDLDATRWQDIYRNGATLRWYDYPKNKDA